MSVNSILLGHKVATSADGIPLDTFTPAAAQTVLALFATFGLAHFMICLLCILVLFRYRALVPFMFLFLLLEHLGRKLILHFLPIIRTGTPPGAYLNLILLGAMVLGLVLSLSRENAVHPVA